MNDLPAPSNIPEYTVSEISGAVKRTLEGAFGRVRVRGEITEMKRYPSGHIYLSLKDEGGKIAAIVWKSSVGRLSLDPENGVEVIATGRVTAYGERSSYQLIIERMEYAGAGALLARIEMLRQRLAAEGLFDPGRKRALPVLPETIGVVTSESGAVIRDIITTVARRFPRRILLWPVPVQGEGAAARIAEAILGFEALAADGAVPRPDVLIVARGGGSLEDLMAFNEEAVLRAVAACAIPVISAVGHETDTTLIDFVSDRRAPTPTAAAELAVPSRTELAANLAQEGARLAGALNRLAQERRMGLQRAERGLPDLPALLGNARQRLDDRAGRLDMAVPNLLAARASALLRAERGLPDPPALVAAARARVRDEGGRLGLALPNLLRSRGAAFAMAASHLRGGLRHAVAARAKLAAPVLHRLTDAPLRASVREARARLAGVAGQLESVSPDAVLARGYARVSDLSGVPVTRVAGVRPGGALRLRFADGEVRVTAAGGRDGGRQGALPL